MPFSTRDEIDQRLIQITELYLKGMPQYKIAEQLNVSASQISRDLDSVRERWKEAQMDNMNEIIYQELEKLDLMERELWEAWDRSKNEFKEVRTKGTKGKKKKEADKDGGAGSDKMAVSEITHTTKQRDPNASYMHLLIQLGERRAKILGYEAQLNNSQNIEVHIHA